MACWVKTWCDAECTACTAIQRSIVALIFISAAPTYNKGLQHILVSLFWCHLLSLLAVV